MRHTRWSRLRLGLVAAVVVVALAASVGIGAASGSTPAASRPIAQSQALAWAQLQSLPQAYAAAVPAPMMTPMAKTKYVYITNTGKKYHKNRCRYLKKSKIKKTLSWAKKHGYKACKVCKPPR